MRTSAILNCLQEAEAQLANHTASMDNKKPTNRYLNLMDFDGDFTAISTIRSCASILGMTSPLKIFKVPVKAATVGRLGLSATCRLKQ